MKVVAQTLSVECKCGGNMLDPRTGSYMITSDTLTLECESCGKIVNANRLPKRATLFV